MKATVFALISILLLAIPLFAKSPYVVVLGVAQDAGAPQMNCNSAFCRRAWMNRSERYTVSSIALVDPRTGGRWIFDATPDLPEQFERLKEKTPDRTNRIAGFFLTHAHIGHYTGLMYLGRESINASNIPVWAMPRMYGYLESNGPWSQLVSLKNIQLNRLKENEPVDIAKDLSVTPFTVPHRDEFSETVGFRISFGGKSLVFIPDIDKWQKWDRKLKDLVEANDFLLVDATFFKDGEIPRPISEVPHPFVTETAELLADLPKQERNKVILIHLNHSNPLLHGDKDAKEYVSNAGLRLAYEGMTLSLGPDTD